MQCVLLANEPGISLIILTPMKILQRNLNRSTFVVWEMKRNVSVVCVCGVPNCCDAEQRSARNFVAISSNKIIKEMPGSLASGTHGICKHAEEMKNRPSGFIWCVLCCFKYMQLYLSFHFMSWGKVRQNLYILGVAYIKIECCNLLSRTHISSFMKLKTFRLSIIKQEESNRISAVTDVT